MPLTMKQVRRVLFEKDQYGKLIHTDLQEFMRDFYIHLRTSNSQRVTYDRAAENKKIDEIAKLLVGDEQCAAVFFFQDKMCIATNRNLHIDERVSYDMRCLVSYDKSHKDVYHLRPILYMEDYQKKQKIYDSGVSFAYKYSSHNNSLNYVSKEQVPASDGHQTVWCKVIANNAPIVFSANVMFRVDLFTGRLFAPQYSAPQSHFAITTTDIEFRRTIQDIYQQPTEVHFAILDHELPSQYGTLLEPCVRLAEIISLRDLQPKYPMFPWYKLSYQDFADDMRLADRMLHTSTNSIYNDMQYNDQLPFEMRGCIHTFTTDPLHSRAEKLVEHLGRFVIIDHMRICNDDRIDEYRETIENNRYNFLINSLFWEIAACLSSLALRNDDGSVNYTTNSNFINEIINSLNKDFGQYNALHQSNDAITQCAEWIRDSIMPNKSYYLDKIPDTVIQSSKQREKFEEKFIPMVERNFASIKGLEVYFSQEGISANPLAQLFEKYMPSNAEKDKLIKIIDVGDDGTHAEVRVSHQHTIIDQRSIDELLYIGITKLCCPMCKLFMDAVGAKNMQYSGVHAKLFGGWKLPEEFREDDSFMRRFLGDDLFERLDGLKDTTFVDPDNKTHMYNKYDFVLEMILLSDGFKQKDLDDLGCGVQALDHNDSLYADDTANIFHLQGTQNHFDQV